MTIQEQYDLTSKIDYAFANQEMRFWLAKGLKPTDEKPKTDIIWGYLP